MQDASIGTPAARPGAPMRRLNDMMADIGYRPSDVTYFAISHGHGDHTANANDFQGSTWLVNKAEYEAMFAEKVPRFYTPATYSALKSAKPVFIDGDHDVFGDGTVVMQADAGTHCRPSGGSSSGSRRPARLRSRGISITIRRR